MEEDLKRMLISQQNLEGKIQEMEVEKLALEGQKQSH